MNSENVTEHRKAIVAYKHRKSRESKVFCVKLRRQLILTKVLIIYCTKYAFI